MYHLPFVMDFILNLTYRCNLRCEMCSQYGENYKENACEELDINYWLDFLQSIKDTEPKPKLVFMGGEPLLYKDFKTLFLAAYNYGFQLHIITNGYYLDKCLPYIKDTNACITVSIDGLFGVHDKIRGLEGLFEKVVSNIEEIGKLQKEGSKISLKINYVLLPDNIDGIVDFYNYFSKYNVEIFTFQHLQSSSEELNNIVQEEWQKRLHQDYCGGLIPKNKYILDENYVEKLKKSLDNFKKYCRKGNCFAFPGLEDSELLDYYTDNNLDKLRLKRICITPWFNPTIEPNGDVSNCIGSIIGNIKNENFWDIWNNEKAQKLRDALLNDGKFSICTKCCNFYKGNFIPAKNCLINIDGNIYKLPDELNYVQSSQKIVFLKDKENNNQEYVSVFPISIHTTNSINAIKKDYEVVTYIK